MFWKNVSCKFHNVANDERRSSVIPSNEMLKLVINNHATNDNKNQDVIGLKKEVGAIRAIVFLLIYITAITCIIYERMYLHVPAFVVAVEV
jgi:uncharacterized membrane protein (DUF485 family)